MNQHLSKSFDFRGNSLELLGLFRAEPHVFFLDSSQYDLHRGRYSFIGFDPFDIFVHKGKDSLKLLKNQFSQYGGEEEQGFTSQRSPLTAGVVGCLSYDYGLHQEKVCRSAQDDLDLPDAFFGFYDCILTVDHFTQKLFITSSGLPEKDGRLREKRASERLDRIVKKVNLYLNGEVNSRRGFIKASSNHPLAFRCNFSREQYWKAAQEALDYIGCGDIYQVNLSQRFEFDLANREFDPLVLYQALRDLSPVPFGGYLNCGDFSLISNSPERFLRLDKGIVQTRPMKGTRPRGGNDDEDRKLREELLNSAKEKAELLMITDLLRNDLGRVCKYGSVQVKEMRAIEEYQYVFQATSTIEGVLDKGKDCFDLIQACFPGGSITGCPKIRAMEIIE
ncbi:MAG: anthranilate synthase component I family protein, partial [Candidatus Omnitrophica bacterium]|nr:anthranilate synthase component I family protein [Candidatus Omnitrophota bacterium]